jgi:glutamine synthetase
VPDPTDVAAVTERLRDQGIDVVRVSYPDMIGVDRGRDVLLGELGTTVGHGLAFCRGVYHTSPMGDVVPVQGGLEDGLPDITVRPDLSTLTALPWERGAAWCLGDAVTPDGAPAPESPRTVARRVAERFTGLGRTLVCGPELEFYLCEPAPGGGWQRYANDLGNVYVVGRKGDPQGVLVDMLRQLRDAGLRVTAANHEFSPGQFEINLGHSELGDAADRSFRLKSAVQEIARHHGLLATFMAKPFNDEGGSGFHVHVSVTDSAGENVFGDPGGPDGLSAAGRHALGGVLAHARALSALLNPTINSYKRFGPDTLPRGSSTGAWTTAARWSGSRRSGARPPGWRSVSATPPPIPIWPWPPSAPPATWASPARWSRPPSWRATVTIRPGLRCCRSGSATPSTRWRPTMNWPRCSASTS